MTILRSFSPFRLSFVIGLGIALAVACGGQTSTGGNSNTNWIHSCESDADCGSGLTCECGACTKTCSTDTCSGLGPGARCVSSPLDLAYSCGASAGPLGICAPRCQSDQDCAEPFACVGGGCLGRRSGKGATGAGGAMTSADFSAVGAGGGEIIQSAGGKTGSGGAAACDPGAVDAGGAPRSQLVGIWRDVDDPTIRHEIQWDADVGHGTWSVTRDGETTVYNALDSGTGPTQGMHFVTAINALTDANLQCRFSRFDWVAFDAMDAGRAQEFPAGTTIFLCETTHDATYSELQSVYATAANYGGVTTTGCNGAPFEQLINIGVTFR